MTLSDLYERKWDETVYIVGCYNASLNVIDSNDLLTSNGLGKYVYKSFITPKHHLRKSSYTQVTLGKDKIDFII